MISYDGRRECSNAERANPPARRDKTPASMLASSRRSPSLSASTAMYWERRAPYTRSRRVRWACLLGRVPKVTARTIVPFKKNRVLSIEPGAPSQVQPGSSGLGEAFSVCRFRVANDKVGVAIAIDVHCRGRDAKPCTRALTRIEDRRVLGVDSVGAAEIDVRLHYAVRWTCSRLRL
jgi:hypothetical protein